MHGEMPEPGEIVVCKIAKVLDYGVFAELLDYNNAKGFVHISQIASGWVKNIRNFVKEGQVRAAQVLAINTQRNQIDLSLTKVSEQAQRARLEEWKQLRRAKKLIEVLAKTTKKPFEETWENTAGNLIEEYGSLHKAFQKIALEGETAAKGVPKHWAKPLADLVKKSIVVPEKVISRTMQLSSLDSEGVETIKKAVEKGLLNSKEKNIKIYYLGSGKYSVSATAYDFKKAEKSLEIVLNSIEKQMKSMGGKAVIEEEE